MKQTIVGVDAREESPTCRALKVNKYVYEEMYDMLCDDWSRDLMKAFVEYRLYEDYEKTLKGYYTHDEYFTTGLFDFSDEEKFVDGGAFEGDSIKQFSYVLKDRFSKIYSFEASGRNFKRLKEGYGFDERIELYNVALGSEEGEASFEELEGEPYANCIKEGGRQKVKVDALDNVLRGKEVTFIKMDIEGAEVGAMRGARQIIKEQKPKLAISLYHLFDDFWQVPMLAKYYVPEYKFYLRYHHESGPFEIVLYAKV